MHDRRVIFTIAFSLALLITSGVYANPNHPCETPLFLQARSGFDSNPLRLARGVPAARSNSLTPAETAENGEPAGGGDPRRADAAALMRPTLSIRCSTSQNTSVRASFTLAVERFLSNPVLNTTAQQGELRLQHRFSHGWASEAFGAIERSNQPDVITTRSSLNFANFTGRRFGTGVSHADAHGTTFAEIYTQGRKYTRFVDTSTTRQTDTLHALAVGRWWMMSPRTFLGLRADYRQNRSNAALYRYREPVISFTWVRLFDRGVRLDVTPRLRWIAFGSRPVSNDPLRTRSDFIPGVFIAIRKELSAGIAATASYAFDKDFSTEPLRRFNDHRFFAGFDVTLGRQRRAHVQEAGSEIHQLQAAELANRGYAAIRRGDWSEALRLSLAAIQIDPTLPEAHTNAGIAHYKLGDRAAAIREWKQSLALRPDDKVQRLLDKASESP